MKIDRNFLEKYSLSICSVLSLIALVVPFVSVETESAYVDSEAQTLTILSGISDGGWLGIALVIVPVLLIAMNYVKPLDKYKGIIAVVGPSVCIAGVIGDFFLVKNQHLSHPRQVKHSVNPSAYRLM